MTNVWQIKLNDLQAYKKEYEEALKTYEEALKACDEAHKALEKALSKLHGKIPSKTFHTEHDKERDREYNKHRLPFFKPDGTRTKTIALSDDEKALLKPLSQWDRYEAYQTILATRIGAGQEDERVA